MNFEVFRRFPISQNMYRQKKESIEDGNWSKNNGGQSWFLTDADFNLYDPSGRKLEQYFGVDDLPFSGEVIQGKSVQGHIFYDVSEATYYELLYKPNFFNQSRN